MTLSPPRSRFRRVARPLVVLGLAYVLVVVMLYFLESRLVFQATTDGFPSLPPAGVSDVTVTLPEKGWTLHAWWLPPNDPVAGAVLFAHGNAGHVAHRAGLMADLRRELGVGVLAFDYPGYGKSEGSPSEATCNVAADAFYAKLTGELKVPANRVILMGESLGGGVATELAAHADHRALVLTKTFTSLPAVAKHLYPILPTHTLMRTRFDNLAKIGRVSPPVFIAHNAADRLVPPAHAVALHAAANEPKALVWMPGDHNDALSPEFYAALRSFLATHAP